MRYQSWAAPDTGLRVNSHFFETGEGVVVVDTQLHLPFAEEVLQRIRATTSGDVRYVINTHAHPDHWYGNTVFRAAFPRAGFITARSVAEDLRLTALPRRERWERLYGDRIPREDELVWPTVVFTGRLTLRLGGLTIHVDEWGPAEANAHTVVHIEEDRVLLTGDVVDSKKHPWVGERHIDDWIAMIEAFPARYSVDRVLPGHGQPGRTELLEESKDWLVNYRRVVERHLDPGATDLTEAGAQRAFEEIVGKYPDYFLPRWGESTNLAIGLRKLDVSFTINRGRPIRTPDGKM
ncbi:MAG: MBL fold metallo-hydrolase [Candidatus Rokubacteria bacterium]|nr:MBL fold metallo-hydrolase [Candidatus Rokubacteria bacterium]MBI3109096.1 MBL fold metallo-hydrolase [Candidatus Rokubacteria bacterium]